MTMYEVKTYIFVRLIR